MKGLRPNQGCYYEVFVRSFADSNGDGIGDIPGLTAKLDYLNDGQGGGLGVSGIWLMPIHPADTYHKYDVKDYYAIDPEYGTLDDFRQLIAECRKRGIHVILDLVMNCTSWQHPWFLDARASENSRFRAFYRWWKPELELQGFSLDASWLGIQPVWRQDGDQQYLGLYHAIMPDLNFDCQALRQEFKNIARFWLDMGVSGFRLDSAMHLYSVAEVPAGKDFDLENIAWWQEFREFCQHIKPDVYLVGEVWHQTSVRAAYMKSLRSVFHFYLGMEIHRCLALGSGGGQALGNFLQAEYALYRNVNGLDYVNAPFLSNHDEERFAGLPGNDLERLKLAAAIYLTLEGLPFVYYGEEIGMKGCRPPDEELRLPLPWGEQDALQTTWRKSVVNLDTASIREQLADSSSLLRHYQRLIQLRCRHEALYQGRLTILHGQEETALCYLMQGDHQEALIIHNLGSRTISLSIDVSKYCLVYATDDSPQPEEAPFDCNALNSLVFVRRVLDAE